MKVSWKQISIFTPLALFVIGLAVFIAACGGHSSSGSSSNAVPSLLTVNPSFVPVGTASQAITLSGNGFTDRSYLTINGISHPAAFVSAQKLMTLLSKSDLASVGNYSIVVSNPKPGGGSSGSVTFSVWNTTTDTITGTSITYPSAWTYSDLAASANGPPRIGFAPTVKKFDPASEYVGDIVEEFIPNPSGDDLDLFYKHVAVINLFENSQSYLYFQVNGHPAVVFSNVSGMIPSDVIAIDNGQTVVEISDLGRQHESDGLLDQFAASVR